MTWRSFLYAVLRLSNDLRAVQRNRVGRRVGRRLYGRMTGKIAARLFR